jgi:hypothetical protein
MAPKGPEKHLNFSWTSPKGLLTAGLFLALALISEFVMVSFFAGAGLTETAYLLIVSPLFHILPLAVIVVLVLSWIYLTKNMATRPYRAVPAKASKIHRRRQRREKSARSSMATIKQFFSKIAAPLSGSSGISFTQRRPSFSRVALESTVTVLTMFLLSIILLSVLLYPRLFADFVAGFYSTTSPLQGFMQALANVLVPIASGLKSIASGFSKAFEGLVAFQPLTGGDLLWRYVFCQITSALILAVYALAHVRYVINARRSR